MPTSNNNGSLTATGSGTEDNIDTITTDGTFVIGIDTNAMVLGDEIEIRVKTKIRSVGTTRLAYLATYKHNQSIPVVFSIPVASTNEIIFTLTEISATGVTFPWEIWEL